MTSKLVPLPDDREDLLYVKKCKKAKSIHCGYKRDYLARNLTGMEEGLVICEICSGIMREASLSNGETTCLVCSESQDLNPVKMVHNAVNQLEVKCPLLRDCTWNGKLSEAEKHLNNCNSFVVECTDCNDFVARGEYDNHKTNTCVFREVVCKFCERQVKAKDMKKHNEVCDDYPISCPNNCGDEFQRCQLSKHKSKCQFEEISCPYTEYGCKVKSILRKDLLAHKKEFYIEHTDMSLIEIQELRKENNSFKKKQSKMEIEGKIMKQLDGVEWEIKNFYKLLINGNLEGPIVYINNYKLRIYLIKDSILSGIYLTKKTTFSEIYLRFYLQRLPGDFDRFLGKAYITQYRIISINKQDITKSNIKDGILNYELCIGKDSEIFYSCYFFDYRDCITADNSLFLRFYFEVNSEKTMET
ncbi:TNF receptor-associated factor 5-like [Oopsacas minuta]|uniref:TNF receptor-associated factor 5-like n=1 Tax=Oopsacas minuta TaxID=111878 RepID=A0AAV7KA84_9METZ|nr:TNF receptor-associated factor 5-like [Oopsacas minuta]